MNDSNRLVFFSPMRGTQKTLHDLKTVLALLNTSEIQSELNQVLIFHDGSTRGNAESLAQEVSRLVSAKIDVKYQALPPMNTLMDNEIFLPLEDGDIILSSGSSTHLGLILNNLKSNSRLIGKSLLLLHPRPNGVELGAYKYTISFGNLDVIKLKLKHPNPQQSLRAILEESNAKIGEVYPRHDTLSRDYRRMIEFDSKNSSEAFRDLLIRKYRISIEKAGEKMEVISGALLSSMHSQFTEIYGNILFTNSKEPSKFHQEEDILAMLTNGDVVWFSSKFSRNTGIINHERRRLLAKLPINFPDKRIHRVILTFSEMAGRSSDSDDGVIVTGLESLPLWVSQLLQNN